MYCPNCGTPNDDNGTFCTSCGSAFRNLEAPRQNPAEAPPMRAPSQQPMQHSSNQRPITIDNKPYKTEFILGLIGSILGIAMFQILFIGGIVEETDWGGGAAIIVSSLLVLAAFILGFVGVSALNKGKGSGGVLLVVGGGLGFIAMFFEIWITWSTLFFFPLLLAGGIMALSRRKIVERDYPHTY
ncbi:MAG: zinc ribbon domain-containing protein [Clostridia bacterium]|jgi:hypothetical protein|nr:zinc ribbon domain-containing protein [Clostridia bacterium]MBT7122233.1 zinc ribbon domain-containing protein [Clostridia bacterium]